VASKRSGPDRPGVSRDWGARDPPGLQAIVSDRLNRNFQLPISAVYQYRVIRAELQGVSGRTRRMRSGDRVTAPGVIAGAAHR